MRGRRSRNRSTSRKHVVWGIDGSFPLASSQCVMHFTLIVVRDFVGMCELHIPWLRSISSRHLLCFFRLDGTSVKLC